MGLTIRPGPEDRAQEEPSFWGAPTTPPSSSTFRLFFGQNDASMGSLIVGKKLGEVIGRSDALVDENEVSKHVSVAALSENVSQRVFRRSRHGADCS
jgi:hypothetical protein